MDKLKLTILDEDQIRVFNYIPKPIINIEKRYKVIPQDELEPHELITKVNKRQASRVIQKRIRYNKPKQFTKTYESYLKLKEKKSENNQNEVNQRLIEMLGETLEMIFEKYQEIQVLTQQKRQLIHKAVEERQSSPNFEKEGLISSQESPYKLGQQVPPKLLKDEIEIQFNEE